MSISLKGPLKSGFAARCSSWLVGCSSDAPLVLPSPTISSSPPSMFWSSWGIDTRSALLTGIVDDYSSTQADLATEGLLLLLGQHVDIGGGEVVPQRQRACTARRSGRTHQMLRSHTPDFFWWNSPWVKFNSQPLSPLLLSINAWGCRLSLWPPHPANTQLASTKRAHTPAPLTCEPVVLQHHLPHAGWKAPVAGDGSGQLVVCSSSSSSPGMATSLQLGGVWPSMVQRSAARRRHKPPPARMCALRGTCCLLLRGP